jgi:hypothetical protein
MPCLLDLPPELIEQIYDPCENDDDQDNMIDFRLTCKYIEKSTRRSFRRWHFACKDITMDDASIERFCVMMKTPGIAKSIEEIEIHADDDGTRARRARETNSGVETSSVDHSTLFMSENPDQLVPAALLRHSGALLEALTAIKNLRVFILRDKACSNDQSVLSANFLRLPKSKYMNEFSCNMTATFDFFLALAARAGNCPKEMWTISNLAELGFTDLASLVTRKQALIKFESLRLDIFSDWRSAADSAEVA